jgi:ribonuclease HI
MEEKCSTCGSKLITKETQKKPSQLKKPFYYTAYLYCPACKKLYHSEKFKVINKPQNLTPMNLYRYAHEYDVEIWTDGACIFNGQANARAAWAFVTHDTEMSGKVMGKQTNNVAEALAIYYALEWAALKGYKRIKLYSDSQISINNIKKSPSLVKQNTEIFIRIAQVISKFNLAVYFEKVVGHSGDINNERADALANRLASNREKI